MISEEIIFVIPDMKFIVSSLCQWTTEESAIFKKYFYSFTKGGLVPRVTCFSTLKVPGALKII